MDAGDLAEELAAMIREDRGANALILIALQPDPAVAASAISATVNLLYRSYLDVGRMVLAAHLGVTFCLGQASLQPKTEVAVLLKKRAHAMSFNAAANCWPGWCDEGVTIDNGHISAGRSLAGLCLELARDLDLGPKARGKAYWLIGALELALGRMASARECFQAAEQSNAALGVAAAETLMAQAYDALAAKYEVHNSGEAADALKAALARLQTLGGEEGRLFADQIKKAERMFDLRRGR